MHIWLYWGALLFVKKKYGWLVAFNATFQHWIGDLHVSPLTRLLLKKQPHTLHCINKLPIKGNLCKRWLWSFYNTLSFMQNQDQRQLISLFNFTCNFNINQFLSDLVSWFVSLNLQLTYRQNAWSGIRCSDKCRKRHYFKHYMCMLSAYNTQTIQWLVQMKLC